MAVGVSSVKFCVVVRVDCTCEVAVMVTTLLATPPVPVGIVPGAVYKPPDEIVPGDPVPVPETLQFTSVLLRFKTLAVH